MIIKKQQLETWKHHFNTFTCLFEVETYFKCQTYILFVFILNELCYVSLLQWNTSQSRVITFSTSDLGTPRQSSWGAFKEETPNLRSGQETILIVSKGIKNTSSHDTQTSEWLGFFLADCQSYYSTDTEMNNTWENMSYSRILLPN